MGDLEKIIEQVKRIRTESVGNWELLGKAIAHLEKNQFRVIQARDGEEACGVIREEIGNERLVVKSKSNLSKEIGLSRFLKKRPVPNRLRTDALHLFSDFFKVTHQR